MSVTAGELAQLQAECAALLLPDTCTIFARTEVDDGRGGITFTYTSQGTVACGIEPIAFARGEQVGGAGAPLPEAQAYVLFAAPPSVTVTNTTRVVAASRPTEALELQNRDPQSIPFLERWRATVVGQS